MTDPWLELHFITSVYVHWPVAPLQRRLQRPPAKSKLLGVGIAHLFQDGCSQRILADIVKSADCGMSLHVGLAGEDEYLERFGEGGR
jgi:hypothetical protein